MSMDNDYYELKAKYDALKKSHTKLVEALEYLKDIFPENDMSELDASDFKDRAMKIFTAAFRAKQALAEAEKL